MDEQRVWLRARRKRRLRILAVILCFCVLFTAYPDILKTLSVFAVVESEQLEVTYISDLKTLPEEIREQTVPVGTGLEGLSLPDTLEAVVTGESQPSEDEGKESGDDGREDTGEETDVDTPGTGDNSGSTEEPEEGEPSDTEQEDTQTDGGTEDKDTEAGDGEDVQPEDGGESEGTDESTETDKEDETDTENGEGGEGESAPSEEQSESENGQENMPSEEQQASAAAQETHTVTMPEYLAENVISVQTLEHTPAEEQEETQAKQEEETVTIDGVTWQSEPEYAGSTEGTYIFTAVLPEGYVLAEGVSLPQITVTVESGTDAMIQALLDRIAALPDGEEYLAAEPDRDKSEKGYAAWEEKLYAYAEEALAIWEEYETLTEQQQARFSEEALGKLKVWVEIAKTAGESAQVMAADIVGSGACGAEGNNVTWELDAEGLLTIRGSGAIADYLSWDESPFYNRRADIKKITIESGVTRIGDCAFYECGKLTTVKIPDSVESIGQQAFDSCIELQSIKIPSGVTSIERSTFWGCEGLKSVEIPDTVTSIEQGAFELCKSLGEVEIPDRVTSIGESAFAYCDALQSVKMSSGVTNIGYKAFLYCSSLESVEIPSKVTSIENSAFAGCTDLAMVSFQGAVPPTVEEWVFDGCSIENIYIPSCQYLDDYRAVEGLSDYQDKIKESGHGGFTYTAAGSVVTQACACKVVSATAELSIKEGADLSYTGSAITPVQVTYRDDWVEQDGNKPGEASIRYEDNIDPGTATAELTIGGATAQISFTIVWKDITAPDKPVLQNGVTLPTAWTKAQDKIPLQLSDDVGVTKLSVSVDGASFTEVKGFPGGTGSVFYDYTSVLEGEHTYQFQAEDAEGNTSAESDIFTIKLDQTKPEIGTLTYEDKAKDFLDWIIGKKSMIIHVPVTDTGSGVTEISCTLTPRGADGDLDEGRAAEKKVTVKDGKAKITFDQDFRGTITIDCTDKVGNGADSVTIGTTGTAGVIVEDRAPDITALADRDLSDTQQTRPGGVAVSEGYYASAPALLVTVKDDTDNAVTAGLDSVSYQVGDSPENSVTFDKSTLQKSAQASFTIPAAQIPTGMTQITVTATDNAGNQADKRITVRVKGPEKQPAAGMDYQEEKLTGLVPGGEYLIGGTVCTADREGKIPIRESWTGSTISIVKKGSGSETTDSPAQSLPIPARPVRPTPTGVDVSTAGGTGKLTGLTADVTYEVSMDGGKTWVSRRADTSGQITGLAPGTYIVHVEAGAGSFASEDSDPVVIDAYKVRVTFMANGTEYKKLTVDYGTALRDIPAAPPKKDAGDQTYTGEWCSDEQGTAPAVFTNITADMTVYAVYTKAYTVTMQTGTGYTLSAQAGSKSPVKEGGSFTFRFALANGCQKTADFAVKVNGVKVELTGDGTYTISDIREKQTVTVEGIAKKPGGRPSDPGGGDKEDEPAPEPDDPQTGTDDQDPGVPAPDPSVKPPAKVTPPAPGTPSPSAGKEPEARKPEGRGPGTTPEQGEGREQAESGKTKEEQEPEDTDTKGPETDSTDAGQTQKGPQVERKEVQIGDGTVIVTVVCEEGKCTAAVADTEKVVKAVLTPGQQALVNSGETIEIRIDVTDISDQVPEQDKEVIEGGIGAHREEVPGLKLGMYVDISMSIRIGAGDWNPITATDGPIEVVIGIPEELQRNGREFYIIRAHEGQYTLMNDLDDVPETITVSTDLFSSYAIAYAETDEGEADSGAKCRLCHMCPTFLGICYFIWLTVITALVLIIYIIWRKKHRKEEQEK